MISITGRGLAEEETQLTGQLSHLRVCWVVAILVCGYAKGDDDVTPSLVAPNGILCLPDGSLLISDIESHRILRLDTSGQLTFWGGTGRAIYSGDGHQTILTSKPAATA